MNKCTRIVLGNLVAFSFLTSILVGCAESDDESAALEARKSAMTCAPMMDVLVTTNYYGAREDPNLPEPWQQGHASAAELVEPGSTYDRFAMAWLRSDRRIDARVYSTLTKSFTAVQTLSTVASPSWVRHMGFDDNCMDHCASRRPTCAWFTWEDDTGLVSWRPVCASGSVPSFTGTLSGHQPSGDTGIVDLGYGQYERKKLLAYITPNREQVMAVLLDDAGNVIPGSTRTLVSYTGTGWKAYQTAVAWSSNEDRWLVAWTTNTYPTASINGQIWTRRVYFDGSLDYGESWVMNCEGSWDLPYCNAKVSSEKDTLTSSTVVEPLGGNYYCACKGIWLSSSYYSQNSLDRYRIGQYFYHAQISASGTRVGTPVTGICSTWCPITESGLSYYGNRAPFQVLKRDNGEHTTKHGRLKENDLATTYDWLNVFSADYELPQAFRSDGNVAIALATTSQSSPTGLKLSIVDVRPNGCP